MSEVIARSDSSTASVGGGEELGGAASGQVGGRVVSRNVGRRGLAAAAALSQTEGVRRACVTTVT